MGDVVSIFKNKDKVTNENKEKAEFDAKAYLAEVEKKNAATRERVRKERLEATKKVIKSERLK